LGFRTEKQHIQYFNVNKESFLSPEHFYRKRETYLSTVVMKKEAGRKNNIIIYILSACKIC